MWPRPPHACRPADLPPCTLSTLFGVFQAQARAKNCSPGLRAAGLGRNFFLGLVGFGDLKFFFSNFSKKSPTKTCDPSKVSCAFQLFSINNKNPVAASVREKKPAAFSQREGRPPFPMGKRRRLRAASRQKARSTAQRDCWAFCLRAARAILKVKLVLLGERPGEARSQPASRTTSEREKFFGFFWKSLAPNDVQTSTNKKIFPHVFLRNSVQIIVYNTIRLF